MGGRIRTDNLPYKICIPVFGFFMPVTCTLVLKSLPKTVILSGFFYCRNISTLFPDTSNIRPYKASH